MAKTKPQKKRKTENPKDEQAGPSTRWNETEESSEDETYVVSEETKDEESTSTPRDTTITENVDDTAKSEGDRESRLEANETEGEGLAISQEMAIPQEMQSHQEMANQAENKVPGKGKKAVKASVSWAPHKEKAAGIRNENR